MYVLDKLRRELRALARQRCEYCLLDERYAGKPHEPDHICAEKHGGETSLNILCLSCFDCNSRKGSDLCSVDPQTVEIVPLFHPRQHTWSEHFQLNRAVIEPLTSTGRVTSRLLDINNPERV
jgi:HNH endonuclease